MNRTWAPLSLPVTLLLLMISAQPISLAANETPQEKQQPQGQKKKTGDSLTGCIDEQDGHYVLVDDRTLTPIAGLEADGFPTEAFAKHLGHKVTVRGISNSGSERPMMKVRTVEPISDTCAPKQQ